MNRIAITLALLMLAACSTPEPTGVESFLPYPDDAQGFITEQPDFPPTFEQEAWTAIMIPDLGMAVTVPAGWELRGELNAYRIGPADGADALQIGVANTIDAFSLEEVEIDLRTQLEGSGITDIDYEQTTISLNPMVIVRADNIGACQYTYIPVFRQQVVGVRFAPGLCDPEDNRLNEGGFAILRSIVFTLPTE
ncbi:MAG: hypothetical protein GYB64_01215 [Chloroflexi bacterium]|nr:hypothetical protein [Chloroflexota bacterium]